MATTPSSDTPFIQLDVRTDTHSVKWAAFIPPDTPDRVTDDLIEAVSQYVENNDKLVFHKNPKGILGSLIADTFPDTGIKPVFFSTHNDDTWETIPYVTEDYSPQGHLWSTFTFLNGIHHGRTTRYDDDGTVTRQGLYIHGNPVGLWQDIKDSMSRETVYKWYTLKPLAGTTMVVEAAPTAPELMKDKQVQADLAHHGLEVVLPHNTGKFFLSPVKTSAFVNASADSLEELLIDDDFLEDLELAAGLEPTSSSTFHIEPGV
jgi:hypothetical protein